MSVKMPLYHELNDTQKMIINLLDEKDKIVVMGGPGTGKTIIGIHAAIKMANIGKKCLFLCYGKTLNSFIKKSFDSQHINNKFIKFDTFYKWFWNILRKDFKLSDEQIYELKQNPGDITCYQYDINKLINLLDKIPEKKLLMYDCIFVDEAQDLQDGMFKILKKFGKKLFITFDDSQRIGDEENGINGLTGQHSTILPDLNLEDNFFDLIDNYRNTKQIENVVKNLLYDPYDINGNSLKQITAKHDGKTPNLIKCDDYDAIINYIIDNYDKSKTIGVLFGSQSGLINKNKEKIMFENIARKFIDITEKSGINFCYKYGIYDTTTNHIDENGIFFMTLINSKGLEFDEVYVINPNINLEEYQGKNILYVAMTRAKSKVNFVIYNRDDTLSNKKLLSLLDEKSYLFDVIDLRTNNK